jgi:uncharacterized membrane protein YebE (DUF533 family)
MEHAFSEQGLGGDGGLLAQLAGGQRGRGGSGGNMLGSLASMAGSMLSGGGGSRGGGSSVGIGGLGALAGALLGGGGDSVKGALGGGALALLGSLAFDALRSSSEGRGPDASFDADHLPLGLRDPVGQVEEEALESKAVLVLQAMINAAKADGAIDRSEMDRIVGKLQEQGADIDSRNFVREQMNGPMNIDAVVSAIRDPQAAAEVYAASLLAIEVDTRAERDYLAQLAQRLAIAPHVVARIHSALGVA